MAKAEHSTEKVTLHPPRLPLHRPPLRDGPPLLCRPRPIGENRTSHSTLVTRYPMSAPCPMAARGQATKTQFQKCPTAVPDIA
eukprot:2907247-Rhodomonas_salina.4